MASIEFQDKNFPDVVRKIEYDKVYDRYYLVRENGRELEREEIEEDEAQLIALKENVYKRGMRKFGWEKETEFLSDFFHIRLTKNDIKKINKQLKENYKKAYDNNDERKMLLYAWLEKASLAVKLLWLKSYSIYIEYLSKDGLIFFAKMQNVGITYWLVQLGNFDYYYENIPIEGEGEITEMVYACENREEVEEWLEEDDNKDDKKNKKKIKDEEKKIFWRSDIFGNDDNSE